MAVAMVGSSLVSLGQAGITPAQATTSPYCPSPGTVCVAYISQWFEPFPGNVQAVHIFGLIHNETGDNATLAGVNLSLPDGSGGTILDTAWSSLDVLGPKEYAPFEAVELPAPNPYSGFTVTGVTFTRSTASPYHNEFAVTIGSCGPDVVCGTVQNTGLGAVAVQSVHVAMTFYLSGVMVAQNDVMLDPSRNDRLNVGETGTFSVDRTGEPGFDTIVPVAEPAYPVDLNPATLAFGNQFVKTTSPAQTVTLTNNGSRALAIQNQNISATSDFGVTTDCPSSLPALTSCQVSVTFTPSVRAAESGVLTVSDDGAGSPETVLLSGTGVAPVVSLDPAGGPDFGSVPVGTPSAPKPITLTNVGTAPLIVTSIALSGDFRRTDPNACLGFLDINASCIISVVFTPSSFGPRTGTLTLTDNALDNPQELTLTGVGLGPGFAFNPTSLTFDGDVAVSQLTVTVTNRGTLAFTITSVSTDLPFSASGCTPPLTLAPQASCVITVTFVAGSGTFNGPGMVAGLLLVTGDFGVRYLPLLGNPAAGRGPTQSSGTPRTGPPPPPPPTS